MRKNTVDSLLAKCKHAYFGYAGTLCLLWMGQLDKDGYGKITMNRKYKRVHRVVFEHFNGPIQIGLVPDHLCRVRQCCNPSHIEPVTPAENHRRGRSGKYQTRRKHCPYGHPYSPENTAIVQGRRICRICRLRRVRAAQAKRKVSNGRKNTR